MPSSQRRRLARAAKQAKQKPAVTVIPAASSSAYEIIGGIESERLEIPACCARASSSDTSHSIISATALDLTIVPKALTQQLEATNHISRTIEGYKSNSQIDECAAPSTALHTLIGFNSTFSFEKTLEYTSPVKAKHQRRWNEPKITSYRRIGAIFEGTGQRALPVARYTSAGGVSTSQDAPSIFDYLALSCVKDQKPAPISSIELSTPNEELALHQDAPVLVPIAFGPASLTPTSPTPTSSGLEENLLLRVVLDEPKGLFSAKVASWAHCELVRLYQAQTAQLHSESTYSAHAPAGDFLQHEPTISEALVETVIFSLCGTDAEVSDIASGQAMVLYQTPYRPAYESSYELRNDSFDGRSKSPSLISDIDDDNSWSPHNTGRVFLSSLNGELFVVNPNQLLYKVKIIDETASDFDSIASPIKADRNNIKGAIELDGSELHCENDRLSDEDTASDFDVPELEGNDSSLVLKPFGIIQEVSFEHTKLLPRHEEYEEGPQEVLFEGKDTKFGTLSEIEKTKLGQRSAEVKESDYKSTDEDLFGNSEEAEDACHATTTVQPTNVAEESSSTAATDWVCELAHTMLGTESLFTFLGELHVESNGNATKTAVATAFLQLVDYERHKLGGALLPRSCPTATILGSRILPHTTVLGSTTLATFLSELDFDLNEETSAVGIYKAFKGLRRAELRAHEVVTTGVMGELGRALGKLT
ncbi:uncharacterized protein K460DRAFT_419192 [Cucurbitaria berberidis CBS 394.84]|uniref:Uncharacterized protein n=1 Tax=Cucurbitaria berberidis CBS 394.84 TaxID=1168544 RepID=A0A9P4GFJ7_9PLEO|nr:uncharacterized protein K460DRAFT_419192 [Cucurbitaria berberidis CBS 394.84]KAF1844255.1 hypothetical protein K460DRAFT_419192 [Cucurbitaria berberidis CBS 394.84]